MPFSDGQDVLTTFADRECPAGGTAGGCPNTTDARQKAADQRPEQVAADVQGLRQRLDALTARTPVLVHATYPVPALQSGTRDETLPWGATLAAPPVSAVVVTDLPPVAEGAITGTVRTLTPTGVVLTVTTSRAVSAGGRIRVLATGWPTG